MMKSSPTFSPDRSIHHILLSQSCKSPDSGLSPVHQALTLMVSNGVNRDKATADIAVRSLCPAGLLEHAIDSLSTVYNFIDDMRNSFIIKPDLVTYTILIDNVCNTKNLREALRLVSVLREEGFKPDCFVYNTIMKGYCMLSNGSEAIEVYNKMKEEGVEPDLVTYNTLIFGLSKAGRVKEDKRFLGIMADMGHFPDESTLKWLKKVKEQGYTI
ncbi:hypothetical protein K1719_046651 [Acacia pycnantha]|nr:hypothetical protein K1719_046651 [Acacia pycnantha]